MNSPPGYNRQVLQNRAMRKLSRAQKREIKAAASKKDEEIDFSDIPPVLDWSGAEIGKFYRPRLETALNLSAAEVEQIRAGIEEGIKEIERGEGKNYDGEEGLKQLFKEIRTRGLKELAVKKRKRIQR